MKTKGGCACCDSLSNLYLWHIKYSLYRVNTKEPIVVIRFQICIFDILNTADTGCIVKGFSCDSLSNLYLWHIKYSDMKNVKFPYMVVIRFQICIFDILNTARNGRYFFATGCDSLSNLYLWHIKYSVGACSLYSLQVVIRFQICIFDILNTATLGRANIQRELWFAFKFVSLTY